MFFGFLSNGVSRRKYVDVPLSRVESLTCLFFNENRVNNDAFSSFVHILSVRKLKRISASTFSFKEVLFRRRVCLIIDDERLTIVYKCY